MTPAMTQEERLAKTAKTNKVRLAVDFVMIGALVLMVISSTIKFPLPTSWFDYLQDSGIFKFVSFTLVSYIHDFSGVVFIVALFIHLWLNWKRLQWLIKAALK